MCDSPTHTVKDEYTLPLKVTDKCKTKSIWALSERYMCGILPLKETCTCHLIPGLASY